MSQIRKEERAGLLYIGCQYSAGVLPGMTPRERAARKQVTREGKQKINKLQRLYSLMKLMSANFRAGRDLFVYLGWAHEPTEREDSSALKAFHRRMRRIFEAAGAEHVYIIVTEEHTRDDTPTRRHHHIVMRGLPRRMQTVIEAAWPYGSVDVRSLRELTDNFEDTCRYLLKEDKHGKRAFSCSQNLKRPPEPLRRKRAESDRLEAPPGVKIVREHTDDITYGRYQIIVGKIVDQVAFDRYWAQAERDRRRVLARQSREKWAKKRRGERPLSRRKSSLTSAHAGADRFGK